MHGQGRSCTAASWNSARSCSISARSGPSVSYWSSLPPASTSFSRASGLSTVATVGLNEMAEVKRLNMMRTTSYSVFSRSAAIADTCAAAA